MILMIEVGSDADVVACSAKCVREPQQAVGRLPAKVPWIRPGPGQPQQRSTPQQQTIAQHSVNRPRYGPLIH